MRLKINLPDFRIDKIIILVIPLVFLSGYFLQYIVTCILILLHELGHIITAVLLNKRIFTIKMLPIGFNAKIEEGTDRWSRIAINISGPMVNLLIAVLCKIYNTYYYTDNMLFFISVNINLLAFNMVPVLPLDGGKVFFELLSARMGFLAAARKMSMLSDVLSVILIIIGAIQLIRTGYNPSILAVGLYLFFAVKSEKTEGALMNVKDIIFRRSRLFKKGVYPARDLVVMQSMHLTETMKHMDFDRFHLIHVLDDELSLIRVYTENEVIENILKHDIDITFLELITEESKK